MSQKMKASSMVVMEQEANTINKCGPNWTWEELQDLIDIWSEQSIIDRLENRRNKSVYVTIAKAMQARGHNHDWTQVRCKIKRFYHVKNVNSHFGAGSTIAPFYHQLSVISKDAGDTPGLVTSRTGVEKEESVLTEAAPSESCTMSMSEDYKDCSVLPEDRHC
ncbi:hypothetical protein Y1Q_0001792 [Alligator mississippiensis]|uniref:Myb/SANT-like DNA-binding domain-containing protein n=1 Tax=Alligator mississippiensis TaxID=8496 RepID=A0A151MKW2_ALLMI|nr:hypothetical protein Y1Q_0001792 [Alligator mississippiensis]